MDDDTFLQHLPTCAACGELIGPNSIDSTTHFHVRDKSGRVGPMVDLHIECARQHQNQALRKLQPGTVTIIEA